VDGASAVSGSPVSGPSCCRVFCRQVFVPRYVTGPDIRASSREAPAAPAVARERARFVCVTAHDLGRRHISWRPRMILLVSVGVAALVAITVLTTTLVFHAGRPGHSPPQAAKPFSLGELGHSGSQVSLAAFAGQPVVVNFFASWCGPCQRETPLLAKFYAAHHGQIRVIGVDSNDPTGALKFVRKEQVSYPVGVDSFPAKTATSYGVLALPQTFFLNARHQIVRHIVGGLTARELNAWATGARSGTGSGAGSGSGAAGGAGAAGSS